MNKVFILIFSCLLVFSIHSESKKADLDELITDIYVKNSFEQFGQGNYEEAFSLANIALSFSEYNSDAYFIRAVSTRNLSLDMNPRNDLIKSIISDNWNYYNEIIARSKLSEFMYLDGDIEDAYLNLLPFSSHLSFSSEYTELFIRISINIGNLDAAIISAENILKVDSKDSYSQLFMATYNPAWLTKAEHILTDGDPSNYISKDVVQFVIKNNLDCDSYIEFYKNRWGEDRFYKISTACKNIDLLPKILSELYPDNTVVDFKELTWLYSLFDNVNSKKLILNKLNSIIITIQYDSDSDGFIDTEALYNNGKFISFKFDSNHDNSFEYFVDLDEKPVRLKILTKNRLYSFTYKNYPYLINVSISDKNTISEYELIPYTLPFEIIFVPEDYTKEMPHILENILFPDNDLLTASSSSKTLKNTEDTILSNYSIIGLDESLEKVFNSDGVKIVERHYKGSVLISVHKDIDGDGFFDSIYDFNDGILQKISFDDNNNGISEYMENYENGLISTWDFNEDGIFDSKEYSDNGIIYRELSSKLDGIFDISLEIKTNME